MLFMEHGIGERWRYLSEQIALEQDAGKFSKLFDEVCLLLERREAKLMAKRKHSAAPESQAGLGS
jgi:hypothetical protein